MSNETTEPSATKVESAENQEGLLDALLDEKERHKLIEGFLKEELELPGYQAKLIAKVLVPSLEKMIKGRVARGFKNTHEALCKRFDKYDEMARQVGRWLGYKLEPQLTKGKALKELTAAPRGMDDEQWGKLAEQSRVWITQLARLDQIALSLGDLSADILLDLDRPKGLAPPPTSRWLRPYNGLIPLTGRTPYLDHLQAFCSTEPVFAWTLLYGDGGMGKTRLAHEFAKEHIGDQWQAGFLKHDRLSRLVAHPGFENWRPLVDTLMVVDYAADKADDLKNLLLRCVRLAGEREGDENPGRLRLLLLERHGQTDQGWLNQLLTAGHGRDQDDIADALVQPLKVVAPGAEATDQAMLEILGLTFKRWGEITGKEHPRLPEFDEKGLLHFRSVTQMRPLFIQMAGIHACETGDALELVRVTRDELLKEAVARERRHVRDKCPQGVPLGCLERAVALLTFTGPQDPQGAAWMRLLADDATVCGFPNEPPGEVCAAAKHLLGQGAEGITPLGPDILAEAFAVTVLLENEGAVRNTLVRIMDLAGAEAWSRVLRAVIDLFHIKDLSVLETWVLDVLPGRPYEELNAVEKRLQQISVAQRRIRACLYENLLKKLPGQADHLPEEARLFGNLGNSYSDLGRREEALEAAQRAAEIYERMAKRNPDAFEPDLARSLNNLGSFFSDLGRREEALEAAQRAAEIYERLAKRNPDAFEPDLASSLNNLGIRYSHLGRREEALEAAQRAAEINERLAKRNPDAFEPDLARSLNNLGTFFSYLGRREEALEAALRAAEIRERLAKRNPDAFEPDLASSLTSQGKFFSELGRREEALEAALRAAEINERLAKRNPDAFEPDLAMSLNNLGTFFSELGRREEALEAALRAAEINERLAKRNPDAFEPDLAMSLNNLGTFFSELGRREEALEAAQRAAEIYERLAKRNPDAFEPDLARSLNNLGTFFSYLGRREEALEAAQRAAEIRERLAKRNPDAFEPDLARSCGAKGAILKAAGRDKEAAASFLKGIKTLNRLFLDSPTPFMQLMVALMKEYLATCQAGEMEPELESLAPVLEKFKALEK